MSRRSRVAGLPAVFTSAAVALGLLTVAPASAVSAGEPRVDAPRLLTGDLQAPPELSVASQSVLPGRPGGHGIFEVVFASTARSVMAVRGLEVRVTVPTGTRIGTIGGKRWRCEVGSDAITAICALRGEVGRDEDPPSITARLEIASTFQASAARIRASARWAGSARTANDWTVSDQGSLTVYPRATLQLSSNASTITAFRNGSDESRQVLLSAEIGKLQDQYAVLAWSQVAGPAVRFLMPQTVDGVSSGAQQIAEFKHPQGRQRYVFAARLVAQGQVVERRISIVVRGDELLEELDAAAPTESAMAAATSLPRLRGALTVEAKRDLRIAGDLYAAADSPVTLRALGDDARHGTVTWSMDGAAIGSGPSVVVTAPSEPGAMALITARVALNSGVVTHAEHLLIADGPETTPQGRSMRRDAASFCQVLVDIRKGQETSGSTVFDMPMGSQGVQRLSFRFERAIIDADALDDRGRCTGTGGIDITAAILVQSQRVRLANVQARLTAGGLVVSSARATVNSSVSNALTDQLGLDIAGELTASWLSGTADGSEPDCNSEELRFFLDAELAANLPGREEPTVFHARADVNLTTLDFTFISGATDMEVGPEELRLTDVRVVVSRGSPTPCVPIGEDATRDDTGISVRFAGTAKILTKKYTLNVQSDARGLCIWGSGDTIDIGGGFRAVSPEVSFTTFPGGATVNGNHTIEANRLVMRGGFVFPHDVSERFQIPGKGVTFEADISKDLEEAHFAVAYNAGHEVTLYQGEGASLSVGQLGFAIDVRWDGTSSGFDGYFLGTGCLTIDGSDVVPASQMPLEVRIGAGYRVGESLRLELTAGVPSGRVTNAFGVEGMTVRRLSAGASLDLVLGAPSVAINADVTLPDGWGDSIGLLPGSAIALGINLDAASPCLEFRVGAAGGEPIVDLGGKGFITGNYLRLVLAPSGCELPDGRRTQKIAAGWAFSVQGALLGSPFEATSLMQIDSTGVRIDAVLAMPRLDLYGVVGFRGHDGASGPRVSLKMDTSRDVFDVSLDAAIEIGDVASGYGVLAAVKGDIRRADDRFVIDLVGRSATSLGPILVVLDPITIKGNIPVAGKESATNQLFVDISTGLSLTLDLDVFGNYTVRGSGRLQMQDFVVTQLSLKAAGEFDAIVYKVQGEVAVDLCMGTLSEIKEDGTGSRCTLFPRASLATSTPAVRVGLTGTQFIPFKDPKPFAKAIYNREGAQR